MLNPKSKHFNRNVEVKSNMLVDMLVTFLTLRFTFGERY